MRTLTIEDFAKWAVCDELPRSTVPMRDLLAEGPRPVPRGSARALDYAAAVDLGSRRDSLVNEFGVIALDVGSEPHADAVAFWRAVTAIEDEKALCMVVPRGVFDGLDIEAHRDIAGAQAVAEAHLDGCLAHAGLAASRQLEDGRHWPSRGCWGLVTFAATMRGFDCEIDAMRLDFYRKNGTPKWFRRVERDVLGQVQTQEVDGLDPKRRVPYPDAYRRIELRPDPTDGLTARIEWYLWRAVLAEAVRRLDGALVDHVILSSDNDNPPWLRAPVRVHQVAGVDVVGPVRKGRRKRAA
jgi:hypothetical protein